MLIDILIYMFCLVSGAFIAVRMYRVKFEKTIAYIIFSISFTVSIMIIWFFDLEIPLVESSVRSSNSYLSFHEAIILTFIKYSCLFIAAAVFPSGKN